MSLKFNIFESAYNSLKYQTAFLLFKKSEKININGIDFCFHYYNEKIYQGDSPPKKLNIDPLQPPYPKYTYVTELNKKASHFIKINKFMFKPGHIVLPTSYKNGNQGDLLNDFDFNAFKIIMNEFKGSGISYYNSGIESGCSQLHKHIQYIPHDDHPLINLIQKNFQFPFQIFYQNINIYSVKEIKNSYFNLYNKMLNFNSNIKNYNFILSKNLALLIPRIKARHELGITLNSLGYCGHFFLFEK